MPPVRAAYLTARSCDHRGMTPQDLQSLVDYHYWSRDRILAAVEPRATGHYTLAGIPAEANVAFFATGTGEAPHNAMIAELLAAGWPGEIVLHEAGRNRVYTAVKTLRQLGLGNALVRYDDGYLIDPIVNIVEDADCV